jgi:predicted nucleotidyltransferase
LKQEDRNTAHELKRRLGDKLKVLDMRLFGSRARGDGDDTSDMDVFVELEEVTREIKNAVSDTAWEVGLEKTIHISALVFSKDEIENSPLRSSPIVRAILREGIRI